MAQLLLILDTGAPLDEVVYYNNGADFEAIYRLRDKVKVLLKKHGVKFTELRPETSFFYDMLERPVCSKQKGTHLGYGWCGGVCRWGTAYKTAAIDKCSQGAKIYVGIAADEPERLARLSPNKVSLLAEHGMTEADCLQYCRERGYHWLEETTATESGWIDLYDILDRVSCWCCCNKNLKELKNIYRYLPQYWERLKYLQSRIERPMKNYCNKKYGQYGDVFTLERIFQSEIEKEAI